MALTEASSAVTETEAGNGNKTTNGTHSGPEVVDEKSPKTPPFSNYWRILSFGTRFEHAVVILAVFCSAASGVALPLLNIVLGGLAGDFTKYFTPGYSVSEDEFKASVATAALYIVYLAIAKFVLTYVARLGFRVMGLRISAAMRLSYMQTLFAQPIETLDRTSTGTVASTITQASNTIQLSISDRLASFFQSITLIIAAFAIAFRYSWVLTLVTSSGILFIIIVYSISTPLTIKVQHAVDKADEKHATVAAETITSIRTVSALNAESKMIEKHSKWVKLSHKNSMKLALHMGGQLTPMFFAIYSCFALAFWFGLKLYREGRIADVSVVIIVFFSVLIVTSVMGSVVQPVMDIVKAVSASGAFFDMIDSETVNATGLKEPTVSALGDIELKGINFAYPTRPNVQVLKEVSLTFPRGKTTALIGPSGCGKSTIVALLERWYELRDGEGQQPDEHVVPASTNGGLTATEQRETTAIIPTGAIMMLGHNVSDFDLRWWRTQIGLVQQDPFLFNDTIENNVAHGLIGTSYENAEPSIKLELVREACQEAFADEFIKRLPDGYASKVGEGGIKLSGGQRQRLAIARSIVRKPTILILDEATSAIDVRGERIVQKALDRASQNRTTIMIAHRLSTIRKADKIVVLRNGTKIEEGTHEQLIADHDGLYRKLIVSQHIEEDGTDSYLENDTGIGKDDLAPQASNLPAKGTRALSSTDSVKDAQDAEMGISSSRYKRKGFFQALMVILYGQRKHWLAYILLMAGVMSCGAANALQSWFFAQLIQAFTYTGQALVDAANFWSLMYFILALAMGLCYAALGISSGIVAAHVGTYFRKQYFTDTLRMSITYFDQEENASGSVMQRLSSDPKQLQELVGLQSAFPLISVFSVVGSAIIAFYFGWKLTLVTFFAVMPLIMLSHYIRVRQEFTFEKVNATVFASSSQFATEAIGAFRTVSSLAMEEVVIAKYRNLLQEQIRTSTRKAIYGTLIYAFSESIELCGMALTFWYGGQLLASQEYNPLQFFVVYSAIILGAQSAGQSLSVTTNIALATAAANRIFELQVAAEKDSDHAGSDNLPNPIPEAAIEKRAQLGASVAFNDVSFNYASNPAPLFSNLDITIPPGQFVGFVGPSGCGKTTTISLLERFYKPTSGTLLFNDQDIATLSTRTYRRNLALVPQEPRLFSGTIRQNLLLGVPDETTITEEAMIQSCRDAEIHDFIASLPEGYDTDLGQSSSTSLSGGQKQRLCLARALLRKPRLLLLDEATSSLDSQSERLVQVAIERLAGERAMTVIAVAHRLATIQKADIIYVFGERDVGRNRGSKIVETGTHAQLLAQRGVYWSMCQAQALDR